MQAAIESMETFNLVAGAASIAGLIMSGLAFLQARRASRAAADARDAILLRTLADELGLVCLRAEQIADFLVHGHLNELTRDVGDLVAALSELPQRRRAFLTEGERNALLTSREQLQSIWELVQERGAALLDSADKNRLISLARRTVVSLREVLGAVKSRLER